MRKVQSEKLLASYPGFSPAEKCGEDPGYKVERFYQILIIVCCSFDSWHARLADEESSNLIYILH